MISGMTSYIAAWLTPFMPTQQFWTFTVTPFAFLAIFMGSQGLLLIMQSRKTRNPLLKFLLGISLMMGAYAVLEFMALNLFIP